MILMCPCIIDFIGGMDYEGEWGGEGALNTPGPHLGPYCLCCVVMEISTGGPGLGECDLTPSWRSAD
jgi:hypothetical protein